MKGLLLIVGILVVVELNAQKTIDLYEGQAPNSKSSDQSEITNYFKAGNDSIRFVRKIVKPELTIYLPAKEKNTGIAVIICPGGGYSGVAIDHEGHDIAKKLQANGIAGFVLKYRMPDNDLVVTKDYVPLMDAQRAIQIVRDNAKLYAVNPNKIGIMGSSAGGHLASTAGTHYNDIQINNINKTSLRPDFIILNYPVISFADSITHLGSRFNLLGRMSMEQLGQTRKEGQSFDELMLKYPFPPEKIKEFSNELQVTTDTPPAFVTHAVDDEGVKVQNSLLFIAALQKNKVPVESFFYAKGGHGYGMVNRTSAVQWIDHCILWIKKINNSAKPVKN